MTKLLLRFLVFVLAATVFTGCSEIKTEGDKPLVYASFYPMYDLAVKAAGEYAEVRCLIDDGVEPHDWEPTPRDIVGLEQAGLFFYSGAGFEEWVPSVIPGIRGKGLVAVETSLGIELSGGDPHVWLSPKNARLQFNAMCEALKKHDPANAEGYERNREYWLAEFDRLDNEFESLRALPLKSIIVTHEAFGYLCEAYGLNQISASGYSPESEPDPASMAKLISLVRELDAKSVFYAELSGYEYASAIAAETDARAVLLSPLEGLSKEEQDIGDDYFSIMRKNLAALKEALG